MGPKRSGSYEVTPAERLCEKRFRDRTTDRKKDTTGSVGVRVNPIRKRVGSVSQMRLTGAGPRGRRSRGQGQPKVARTGAQRRLAAPCGLRLPWQGPREQRRHRKAWAANASATAPLREHRRSHDGQRTTNSHLAAKDSSERRGSRGQCCGHANDVYVVA